MTSVAPIPCLVGLTGSGKSDVAIEVARRLGAEVIACDSMTVYRGFPVLTAQPTAPADVPHHLVGFLDPTDSYSAARFLADAERTVADVVARGKVPLLVGGTALYLMAFVKGLGAGVGRDPSLRARLEAEVAEAGPAALHARLAAADPARAAALHAHDVRRVVRALEIALGTGEPASARRREWTAPDRRPTAIVGLARAPEDLERRIRARARRMLEGGALEEAAALRAAGTAPSKEVLQALGVRDLWACLDGRLSREETAERMSRATLRFAKRQRTFLKKFAVTWVDAGEDEPAPAVAERALAAFAAAGVAFG